jgi:hypothetical protein
MRIRDPGWRQFGSGMEKSRIRDKHPGSATLFVTLETLLLDEKNHLNVKCELVNFQLFAMLEGFLAEMTRERFRP